MAEGNVSQPVVLNRVGYINDCNDLTKTGIYYAISTSTNTPATYGVVLHLEMQPDVKAQLFIGVSNNLFYYRRSANYVWGSWRKLDETSVSYESVVSYDSTITGSSNITIFGGSVARLSLEFTKSNLTSGATIGYIDSAYSQKGGRIVIPVIDDGAGTVNGSLYVNFGATGLGIRYYGPTTSSKIYAECTYILNNPIN